MDLSFLDATGISGSHMMLWIKVRKRILNAQYTFRRKNSEQICDFKKKLQPEWVWTEDKSLEDYVLILHVAKNCLSSSRKFEAKSIGQSKSAIQKTQVDTQFEDLVSSRCWTLISGIFNENTQEMRLQKNLQKSSIKQ